MWSFFKKRKKTSTDKKFENYQEMHKDFINTANTTIAVSKELSKHMSNKLDTYIRHISTTAKILSDALIVIDDTGLIQKINPAGEKLFGWTQNELKGKRLINIFKSSKNMSYEKFLEVLQKEKCHDIGTTISGNKIDIYGLKKDNTTFSVNISVSTYLNNENNVITLFLVRDVTEQENIKKLLEEKEEFYRTIFEMSFDAIGIIKNYKIIKANNSFLNLFGIKKYNDLDFRDFIRPEFSNQFEVIHERHLQGEDCAFEFEISCQKINDKQLNLIIGCALVGTENNYASLITLKDITYRKNYEDQMSSSLELKNLLFQSIPHVIFIKDKDDRYIDVNDAFVTYFGVPKDKIIGCYPSDIAPKYLAKLYNITDKELHNHPHWLEYHGQICNQETNVIHSGIFYKRALLKDGKYNGQIGVFVPTNKELNNIEIKDIISIGISSVAQFKSYFDTIIKNKIINENNIKQIQNPKCELDKLIDTHQEQLKILPNYDELVHVHHKFHQSSSEILQLLISGNYDNAIKLLEDDHSNYNKMSSKIINIFMSWNKY